MAKIAGMATTNSRLTNHTDAGTPTGKAPRATAKRAPRWQIDALHHMAHELRTPLNIILGFAQLLHDPETSTNLTNEQRHHVERISTAAHTLEEIIATMLEMSSIEAGQLRLRQVSVAPLELLRAACDQMEALAAAHQITFSIQVAPDVPPVLVDRARIQQVFFNLIGNAITFAPTASIITVGAQRGVGQSVECFVRDQGPGIPKRHHAAIFKPFTQVATDPAHKHHGSGLGLAIARQLVQLHGGRLWVQSDARRGGSTFWVRLPLATEASSD
jgi:two-component system sensor histidine kinase BarA